jgi:hypothetical protein
MIDRLNEVAHAFDKKEPMHVAIAAISLELLNPRQRRSDL